MIPDIEKKALNEISIYQMERLKEALQYLSQNSPFYKELFANHNIAPNSINSLSDLQKLPTTSKEDFSKRNLHFLCVNKTEIADYCTTSGTTGDAVTIALTAKDIERLAYNEAISFACADGKAGDVYQLMLTLDRHFMAGMAYYAGIHKLGASTVRVGPGPPQMQIENILRFQPTTLVAIPSFLLKLIEYAEANGIDLNSSSVKSAVCIGESIRDSSFGNNALSERIQAKWNIKLYSTYASSEMQTAFTECVHGNGGHHHPELLIVEILDDEGTQLKAGEYGEVTITSLGVEGMPLLRYRTGDICAYYDEPCACGRNTIRLSPVSGRKNQMIKYKGTTIYPPAIQDALSTVREIQDYIIEISQSDIGTDEILIHVCQNGNHDATEQKIKAALQSKIRVIPSLNFVSTTVIQGMRPASSRKPLSVIFK
ncbi:MAG: phenylacetate--CoA ligase family protein [Bacteroidetes bacterium]|nr:phenylacetate--CoA ligase family protein [Bacteroidota bacterium]